MKKITFLLLNLFIAGFLTAQGDNCAAGVTTLTINNCASFTNNEDFNLVNEPSTSTCSGATGQSDIWYRIVGNGSPLFLSYFSDQDIAIGVYQTTCPTLLNFASADVACQQTAANSEGLLSFNSVNATVYFVRIQRRNGTNTTDQSGSICVYTAANLPGKTCGQAIASTVGTFCSSTPWSNTDDGTIVGNFSNPCGTGTAYQDIWYSVAGTGNPIGVNIFDVAGQSVVLSVYSSCPSYNNQGASDIACTQIGTGTSGLGGVNFNSTLGTTYYISLRRSTGNATDDQSGAICFYDYAVGSCGNNLGLLNDDCNNPAMIQKIVGASFSGTTGGVFTVDQAGPSNGVGTGSVASSCFIIHNNSWYEFTATGSTETFTFTSAATTCSNIQAMVFQPIFNGAGCCSNFISRSACFGPTGTSVPGATITASGLSAGNKYLLMIDGYNGVDCDFTVLDWGAPVGEVLGVSLSNFSVLKMDSRNLLRWETASENQNALFEVQRSFDGENFEVIETIEGAGNSSTEINYSFEDNNIRFGTVYYRLNQVDFDGTSTFSKILSLDRDEANNGIVAIYPNPADQSTTIDISTSSPSGGSISIYSASGILFYQQDLEGIGVHQINLDVEEFPQGYYIVQFEDQNMKMVKNLVKY
ncbi:MAG: T9SS type A sorting domain-containing protein [Bacteroidota bacterium]